MLQLQKFTCQSEIHNLMFSWGNPTQNSFLVLNNFTDKSTLQSFRSVHAYNKKKRWAISNKFCSKNACNLLAASEAELTDQTVVTNDFRKTLERSHISSKSNINFLDAKEGILCTITNITCSDQIHAGTETGAVDSSNDRLGAFFNSSECGLETLNVRANSPSSTSRISAILVV